MKRKLLSVALAALIALGVAASFAACAPKTVMTESGRVDYFASEVLPNVKFDPASYASIKLTLSADLLIDDGDVRDTIDLLRFEKRSVVNGLTQVTDQPLRMGDDAYIYYRGVVDGKEFEGGSNMDQTSPYELGLGSGAFIPGFAEQLVGVIPSNTSKDKPHAVNVTFPENYGAKELAGRKATFYVVVEYAVQYNMPAYDRDFIINVAMHTPSSADIDDKALFAEYEATVRKNLEEQNKENVDMAKYNALWDYLLTKFECKELPEEEVDYYYNRSVSQIESEYRSYSTDTATGTMFLSEYPTLDDYARVRAGATEGKDWKALMREYAEVVVQKDMIGHAVAEKEGIEALTDEEYNKEVEYWVEYYESYNGMLYTAEDIIKQMGEEYLRESAFAMKMQNFFYDRVTVTYAN